MKKNTKGEGQLPLTGTPEEEILARLSERVEKAVQAIQELRRERDALKARLKEAEAELKHSGGASGKLSSLEEEHRRFQKEREEIRDRIEMILSNLEALDSSE